MVSAKAVFLVKFTYYGLDYTNCIFKERLKEVLRIKAFNSASVENYFGQKRNCEEETKPRANFVVKILHVCGRKDINGSCFLAVLHFIIWLAH